ncbi:MAG: hypothetical protein ACYDC2_05995 [Solirubrobacteraceae bacterium]
MSVRHRLPRVGGLGFRRAACAAVLAVIAILGGAAVAVAIPPPRPLQQAVTIVKAGVVWYDDGVVRLIDHAGRRRVLASWSESASEGPPQISSSGTAVALEAGDRLRGGLPPAPLSLLAAGRPVGQGRLRCWRPQLHGIVDFAVAADQLVIAAEQLCRSPGSSAQPLFAKNLRGGRWRVIRWLTTSAPPILAADGDLLAIGVQRSLSSLMDVRVLDVASASTRWRLRLPEGYLAFAAPDRLVVSIPTFASFPLQTRVETPNGTYARAGSLGGGYRVGVFDTNGRLLASLGASDEQPRISAGRRITISYSSRTESQTLSVADIPNGPSRAVVGFNAGRALNTFAWRWPLLAVIETASAALPNGQFSCQHGTYAPPTPPTLATFDLSRASPLVPAPPVPPQPDFQQVFATCGAPPP